MSGVNMVKKPCQLGDSYDWYNSTSRSTSTTGETASHYGHLVHERC